MLEHIAGDGTSWEKSLLEQLTREDQLMAWTHSEFWEPVDTLNDKRQFEEL